MTLDNPRRSIPDPRGFWAAVTVQLLTLLLFGTMVLSLFRTAWNWFGFAPPTASAEVRATAAGIIVRGQVVSTRAKGIGSPFAARVKTLLAEKGQRVKRGQLLFQMDDSELRRQLEEAKSALRRAEAEIRDARRERLALRARLQAEQEAVARQLAQVAAENTVSLEWPATGEQSGSWTAANPSSLSSRLHSLRAAGSRLGQGADVRMAAAASRKQQAAARAERLEKLLRQVKRYSPIDGVVTSIRAGAGSWTAAFTPVLRVDDPAGYRLVALVRNRSHVVPAAGDHVPVYWADQTYPARVSKIVPGWDREALYTWIWLTPPQGAELFPGDALEIHLSRAEAGRLAATSGTP
jgi:HlyD family secretion protein